MKTPIHHFPATQAHAAAGTLAVGGEGWNEAHGLLASPRAKEILGGSVRLEEVIGGIVRKKGISLKTHSTPISCSHINTHAVPINSRTPLRFIAFP